MRAQIEDAPLTKDNISHPLLLAHYDQLVHQLHPHQTMIEYLFTEEVISDDQRRLIENEELPGKKIQRLLYYVDQAGQVIRLPG